MGEYGRKPYQTTFSKRLPHQIKLIKKTSNGLGPVTITKKKWKDYGFRNRGLRLFIHQLCKTEMMLEEETRSERQTDMTSTL